MITIKQIAEEANVSVASVSRYFNNKAVLSLKKQKAIADVVDKHGYVPNSIGRSLRMARSGKILILLPTMENPMYLRIITAIENECYQYGYTALVCDTHRNPHKERHLLSMLENHYADGAILFSSTLNGKELESLAKRYPIVLCCEQRPDAAVASVSIDDYAAAYEAVEHLLNMGHTRIAIALGSEVYGSTVFRREGYMDALKSRNISITADYILVGDYGYNSGMKCVEKLAKIKPMPTAVLCISDAVAIGAIKKCRELDIKMAVAGFDNTSITRVYMPSVTSVAQPRSLMGTTAMQLLHAMIMNPKEKHVKKILPHQLVVRESTLIC
ncbi:MAG: LacI family DNA-binding transcriptional regulator [Clostridia bacterium]|nr:LacI family DNA-binding transcriptional regulator [Clostridia bacterium]